MLLELSKRETIIGDGNVRLQMWISRSEDTVPHELFVYQRTPAVPDLNLDNRTEPTGSFAHIASYHDVLQFPADNPDPDLAPFFRKHFLDLEFEDQELLAETVTLTQAFLTYTLRDILHKNNLPEDAVIIEDVP